MSETICIHRQNIQDRLKSHNYYLDYRNLSKERAMDDLDESEFFNALDRVTKNPVSFSGMLEYFMNHKPEQWLKVVGLLMELSRRNYSNAQDLGTELEHMIDEYAEFMDS